MSYIYVACIPPHSYICIYMFIQYNHIQSIHATGTSSQAVLFLRETALYVIIYTERGASECLVYPFRMVSSAHHNNNSSSNSNNKSRNKSSNKLQLPQQQQQQVATMTTAAPDTYHRQQKQRQQQ